jgi:hypothetical protein
MILILRKDIFRNIMEHTGIKNTIWIMRGKNGSSYPMQLFLISLQFFN